jgi:simple sugar transport system ATP-binding protein
VDHAEVSTTGAGPPGPAPALELRDVSKSYGHVQALSDASLTIMAGEIHGLVGDNGAGKSTLLKIAAGALQPDRGSVLVDGDEVRLSSPEHARQLGIETVYQDLALAETRSCVANVFVGREVTKRGLAGRVGVLDRKAMRLRTLDEFRALGVPVRNVGQPIGALSGGQRQGVAIARAAMWASHIVLLDEPTAALGIRQRAAVMALIEQLRDRGLGVLLISHDVPEVLRVCDRVTVLRLGSVNVTAPAGDIDMPYVVASMVGGTSR